jgi:hypothetical protein
LESVNSATFSPRRFYGVVIRPVTRAMNIIEAAENLPDPQLVLAAVAEKDFQTVMPTLPDRWRRDLVLL